MDDYSPSHPLIRRFPVLDRLIKPSDKINPHGIDLIRIFSKGFFDLIKNLLVVGGLKYLSDKTGSVVLSAVSYASILILGAWAWSFIAYWDIHIFRHLPWKTFGKAMDGLLTFVLTISALIIFFRIIEPAIYSIAEAQKQR